MVVLGIVLGLDNARVAFALGATGIGTSAAVRFSAAFAGFEMMMPLVGATAGRSIGATVEPWAEGLGAVTLAVVGLYVILLGLRNGANGGTVDRSWMVLGLPLSLSIDNLFAGIGIGLLGFPVIFSAAALGAVSGILCFAGFRVGHLLARALAKPAQITAGVALVGLSVVAYV